MTPRICGGLPWRLAICFAESAPIPNLTVLHVAAQAIKLSRKPRRGKTAHMQELLSCGWCPIRTPFAKSSIPNPNHQSQPPIQTTIGPRNKGSPLGTLTKSGGWKDQKVKRSIRLQLRLGFEGSLDFPKNCSVQAVQTSRGGSNTLEGLVSCWLPFKYSQLKGVHQY